MCLGGEVSGPEAAWYPLHKELIRPLQASRRISKLTGPTPSHRVRELLVLEFPVPKAFLPIPRNQHVGFQTHRLGCYGGSRDIRKFGVVSKDQHRYLMASTTTTP